MIHRLRIVNTPKSASIFHGSTVDLPGQTGAEQLENSAENAPPLNMKDSCKFENDVLPTWNVDEFFFEEAGRLEFSRANEAILAGRLAAEKALDGA